MSLETLDLLLGWLSLALTLFVFSYLLGDNVLYRLATHLLVGLTAAYVAILAVESVILPWLDFTLLSPTGENSVGLRLVGVLPLLVGVSLLMKLSPNTSRLGNLGLALIIGVGTSVALVGAVIGTLIPMVESTGESYETQNSLNATLLVVGTVSTLIHFQYLARRRVDGRIVRRWPVRFLAAIGGGFIALTFGALYGGVLLTSLNVFGGVVAEQLTFLLKQVG
jgi:hypothetical protein